MLGVVLNSRSDEEAEDKYNYYYNYASKKKPQ